MTVLKKLAKKISGPREKEIESLIMKLISNEKFHGNELNILDVGCGKGIILKNIKKLLKEDKYRKVLFNENIICI